MGLLPKCDDQAAIMVVVKITTGPMLREWQYPTRAIAPLS